VIGGTSEAGGKAEGIPKLGIFFSLGSSFPKLAKYPSRPVRNGSVPK